MQADDLIYKAMRSAGGMPDGKGLFVVEGHVGKNDFTVRPLTQVYQDNYLAFIYGLNHGYIMMGIFKTEVAAGEYIAMIRTLGRDEQGNRIE